MKKSRTRQKSHRTSTPSVICLPPPKPPISVPRKEPEAERALRLPKADEQLVIPKPQSSRQMRRKVLRAEAKAIRGGSVPERTPTPAAHSTSATPEATPLPRNRALVLPTTGLVARVNRWLSRLVSRRSAMRPGVSEQALAEQMLALRTELTLVQGRLDRMIAAVSRN